MEIRYAQSGDVSLAHVIEGGSGLGSDFRDASSLERKGLGPRRLPAVEVH